jgi:hypothetical protein
MGSQRLTGAMNSARLPVPRRRRPWLRWLVSAAVLFLLLNIGSDWLLARPAVRRRLTARLESAIGRPVEVESYSLTLLGVPQLQASSVQVAEDPRFGEEYFMHADELTISPRWLALVRGRMEIATLSLTRPSLNLVLSADGRWNLAEWLPHAGPAVEGTSAGAAARVPRFEKIAISGGRINFKHGPEKLAFALVNVDGYFQQESDGRWMMDLEAQPFRAAVSLQEAGELRLQGKVGGTTARFRPAELAFTWEDASISDVLRFLRRRDYGARGTFSLSMNASTSGPDWKLSAAAQARRLHRWDFPSRPDNPGANLYLLALWHGAAGQLEIQQAQVELPRSKIHAAGALVLAVQQNGGGIAHPNLDLSVNSSSVRLEDLLAWLRAFHSGVAEELQAPGNATFSATLAGWPPVVGSATLTLHEAALEGGSLPSPARLSPVNLDLANDHLSVAPIDVTLGENAGSFRVQGAARRQNGWKSVVKLDGSAGDAADVLAIAAALGWPVPRGWNARGPVQASLSWDGGLLPDFRAPLGSVRAEGVEVHAPFLNRAAILTAQAEFKPGETQIQLSVGRALGAEWSGKIHRRANERVWSWDLAADRLDASEMGAWLNPQRREGLLDRILPFLASPAAPPELPRMHGNGILRVAEWVIAPLRLETVRAQAQWDGQRIELANFTASAAGGTATGSFEADFAAMPVYRSDIKFERINLSQLTSISPLLADRFGGVASGNIHLRGSGLSRAEFAGSLECSGSATVRGAEWNAMDLAGTLRSGSLQSGRSFFPVVAGDFRCGDGAVNLSELSLGPGESAGRASGKVDFHGTLEMRVEGPARAGENAAAKKSRDAAVLTGTISTPAAARPL